MTSPAIARRIATACIAAAVATVAVVLAGVSLARAAPVDEMGAYRLGQPTASYPPSGWRSSLYPADWTPQETDGSGRFLHDFSYAGYRYGEEPLPAREGSLTVDVTEFPFSADARGRADSTKAIQRAIDYVGRAGGGVVYLPAGMYRVAPLPGTGEALRISHDNVTLRGAGRDRTFVFNTSTSMARKSVIAVRPRVATAWSGSEPGFANLAESSLAGSKTVKVTDPWSFSVGDLIIIRTEASDAWLRSMGSPFGWNAATMDASTYLRTVESVNGDGRLGIDIPLRSDVLVRDKGTRPNVYLAGRHLREVGVEDLSIGMREHRGGPTLATDVHESTALRFTNVVDGWILRLGTFAPPGNRPDVHLLSEAIWLNRSRSVTVRDCLLRFPQYRGGGDGYGFIVRGSDNLIERCSVDRARHSYSFSYGHTTGNVVRDSTAANAWLASDFHAWLAAANLVEGVRLDGEWIDATYRYDGTSIAHGPSTSQSVIWNAAGLRPPATPGYGYPGALVHSVQWGWGAVVGTSGDFFGVVTDPGTDGWRADRFIDLAEGVGAGATLVPASLSRDQLDRRVGDAQNRTACVQGAVLTPTVDVAVMGRHETATSPTVSVRGGQSWHLAFALPQGTPISSARLVVFGRGRTSGGAMAVHRAATPQARPSTSALSTNVRGTSPASAAWVFDVTEAVRSSASTDTTRTLSLRVTEALAAGGVDFATSRFASEELRPRLEIEREPAARLAATASPRAAAVLDGSAATALPLNASGVPLVLDLGAARRVTAVGIAFADGSTGFRYAEVQVSEDGERFTPVRGIVSSGEHSAMERYEFDGATRVRYVRLVGFGSSDIAAPWDARASEVEVYGD